MYVDGAYVASGLRNELDAATFGSDILIGRTDKDLIGDPQFIGGIDELRLYGRGFTRNEVKALYEKELEDTNGFSQSLDLDSANTHLLESTNFIRARSAFDHTKHSQLKTKLVTHREFQKLYPEPDSDTVKDAESVGAFSVFHQLKTDAGNSEEGEFYRVGDSHGNHLGWIKKEDVAVWNTRCVLLPIYSISGGYFTLYNIKIGEKRADLVVFIDKPPAQKKLRLALILSPPEKEEGDDTMYDVLCLDRTADQSSVAELTGDDGMGKSEFTSGSFRTAASQSIQELAGDEATSFEGSAPVRDEDGHLVAHKSVLVSHQELKEFVEELDILIGKFEKKRYQPKNWNLYPIGEFTNVRFRTADRRGTSSNL